MFKPTLLQLLFFLLLIIVGYYLFYVYAYILLKYFYRERIEGFENAMANADAMANANAIANADAIANSKKTKEKRTIQTEESLLKQTEEYS
jgi:hypothetical protein